MNETNILLSEELPSQSFDVLAAEESSVEGETSVESDIVESSAGDEISPVPEPSVSVPDNAIYVDGDVVLSMAETEAEIPAIYAIEPDSVELPYNAVVLAWNGQDVVFPSDYADDLSVSAGILVNTSNSVTVGMRLRSSASVPGTYVISEVTIPTYNSGTYYQYLSSYGAPYRIVDRYVYGGSYRSEVRDSSSALDFTGAELSGFRGFGNVTMTFFIFGLFLVLAAIIGRFRRV